MIRCAWQRMPATIDNIKRILAFQPSVIVTRNGIIHRRRVEMVMKLYQFPRSNFSFLASCFKDRRNDFAQPTQMHVIINAVNTLSVASSKLTIRQSAAENEHVILSATCQPCTDTQQIQSFTRGSFLNGINLFWFSFSHSFNTKKKSPIVSYLQSTSLYCMSALKNDHTFLHQLHLMKTTTMRVQCIVILFLQSTKIFQSCAQW